MSLTLTLTKEQAIELLYQMPPEEKMAVLIELATQARDGLEEQMRYGESKVRQLCAKRGLDWDAMSEQEREDFIDDIVHEDRACSQ